MAGIEEEEFVDRRTKTRNIGGCLGWVEKITFLGPNPIVVLQIICYALCLLFGFLVCIPVGISLRRFNGNCILYAQVVWDDQHIWPWDESSCDFLLYWNLGVNVIYVSLMILFLLVFVLPRIDHEHYISTARNKRKMKKVMDKIGRINKYQNSFFLRNMNPVMSVINFLLLLAQLSAAVVLTVGFDRFCNSLEKAMRRLNMPMSCASAQSGVDWTEFTMVKSRVDEGPNGQGFFTSFTIALIGSWSLFVLWLFQFVINCSQVCTRCSCAIAEEKVKISQSQRIAARRSRLATPSMTPGGGYSQGGGIPVAPPMGGAAPRGPMSVSSAYIPAGQPGQPYPPAQPYPPPQSRGPQSTSSFQMPPGWAGRPSGTSEA